MRLSFAPLYNLFLPIFLLSLGGAGQWVLVQASVNQGAQTEAALVTQLADANEEQRINALVELTSLFRAHLRSLQPATVLAVGKVLQNDPVPLVRTFAAHALELAGDSAARELLLMAFTTEREIATRKAILYALVRYTGSQVTTTLLPLLNHKQPELRATAAFVLAEQADTAAAASLLAFLPKHRGGADGFARSQAIRGLGRIGYQAAVPMLLTSLQKDSSQIVRREAAIALGWLTTTNERAVIAALREAQRDEDPYLRTAALSALEKINARLQQSN
jgi:HEAT repeat protein